MAKYTDEQIKKALECCSKGVYKDGCTLCPFFHENCTDDEKMLKSVLDLINRLEAENAKLKEKNRLACQCTPKAIRRTRTEAIKEFAERLKKELSFGKYIQPDQIDNLVKEMVGESE